jgi:diguanylate cyclase (GGDEF)-like protein
MTTAVPLPRILIVDDSRIVRATIIKRIRDRFDVREEADGEAGWETLLIDPSIQLVISDLSMPRLDGYGLVERMRASKVGRIREMPVIMISGEEDEAARQRAKDLGATDFLAKGIGAVELLARLDSLIHLAKTSANLDQARADAVTDAASGLLTRNLLIRQARQALAYAVRHGGHVGALVIGLDHFERLVAAEGGDTAESLLNQFARMLAAVVRKEDCLCRWNHSHFAIVTPGLDRRHTSLFAERLCAAVATARIQHLGRPLHLAITVGTASSPFDGSSDVDAILAMAEQRMLRGSAEGGNRVVGDGIPLAEEDHPGIDEALRQVAGGDLDILRPHLRQLGVRLLPLLRQMDEELHLGLPLAEMERRLAAGKTSEQVLTAENQ